MNVWFDLETRSRKDLKAVGVYSYAQCEDFKILMAGWNTTGNPADTWTTDSHEESVETFQMLWDLGAVFTGHNVAFDRVAMSAALGMPVGTYLDPERFRDTMAFAGQRGLPKNLENLAKVLHVEEKDTAGKDLIRYWCKPISAGRRKGEFRSPEEDPEKFQRFLDYLRQDVDTLIAVDKVLGDHVTDTERRVFNLDQRINDYGIPIDLDLAVAAKRAADINQEEQKERVRELTLFEVNNPGAPGQMRAWLLEQDDVDEKRLPNMQAETVEALLEDMPQGVTREVLELRQELALAAPAKFSSALGMQTGGRLRGTLQYFGAHTGRASGRGTQPHNLPRAAFEGPAHLKKSDPDLWLQLALLDQDMAIADVLAGEPISSEDLKKLVRPMFLGPMTVVDYAAIEARVIAWLAGEEWALQAFRDGRDIYVETGLRMGGLNRSQGKVAVLALGFGGSSGALKNMCYPGDPILEMSDEDVRDVFVHPWRRANPNICQLWSAVGRGMGESGRIGKRLKMTHNRGHSGITTKSHLPSGRAIEYHDVRWESYVITDKKTKKRVHKEGWRYQNAQIPFSHNARIGTWGGSLVENIVQGVARDLLVEGMLRLEEAGYRVIAHVHDEVLIEGEHDVEEITRILCELPAWADGLPMGGEGFVTQRYRKG